MADTQSHAHPNYVLIWVYLLVLTVLEVLVARWTGLNRNMIVIALLVMAVWKALLVALYFMHLKFEPKRLVIMTAIPLPLAVILVMFVMQEFG